jgi:hypothetical protein
MRRDRPYPLRTAIRRLRSSQRRATGFHAGLAAAAPEAGGLQARHCPPAGVPRGGLHGSLPPVVRLERLTNLARLAPRAGETTAARPVEPTPAGVLAAAAPGWRRPSSGRARPKTTPALCDHIRRLGNVFLQGWAGAVCAGRGGGRGPYCGGFARALRGQTPRAATAAAPQNWPPHSRERGGLGGARTRPAGEAAARPGLLPLWRSRRPPGLRHDRGGARGPP